MSSEERIKEIREAINLLGWNATLDRLRTPEDRAIWDELYNEDTTRTRARGDKLLKEHHIKF